MNDLIISIVAYQNKPEILSKTIESVLGSKLDLHLYLLDNSPSDTLRSLVSKDERASYIHLPHNPGFGAAHNHAIRLSLLNTKYHLVLNPDVFFSSQILHEMVEYMEEHPMVGLTSPKILFPNGDLQPLCKLLPTPWQALVRRLFPNTDWVKARNAIYELRFTGYDQEMEVPSLSGCFMLLRVDVLKNIGGFDERFFMYFEDVDLVRRVRQSTIARFLPQYIIFHHYEKGSYHNYRLLKIHIQSAIRYFGKWGWFFDHERSRTNKQALSILQKLRSPS